MCDFYLCQYPSFVHAAEIGLMIPPAVSLLESPGVVEDVRRRMSFDALTAERPYRSALPLKEVYAIMDKEAGAALDEDCIAALKLTQRDEGACYQND